MAVSRSARRDRLVGLLQFVGRRLVFGAAILLAIIYLTNFGLLAAQGVDFSTALSDGFTRSVDYLVRLSQGDLGQTIPGSAAFRPQPVGEVVSVAFVRSLGLLGAAFFVAISVGVPLGIWAAYRRHTRKAIFLLIGSFIGMSTPSFFAALFLQIAAIQYTRTFGQSIVPVGGFGWDRHLVLPMLVLAARPIAQITRVTFVSLSNVLDQDYVRTARSKGVRPDYMFIVHVARNAAIPILTTIIVSLRFSLGSLPVVELYFGWNGLGETLLRSMFILDTNLVTILLMCLGFLFILINLLLETSYYLIDPRLLSAVNGVSQADRAGFLTGIQSFLAEIIHFLNHNPLSEWVRRLGKRSAEKAVPQGIQLLEKNEQQLVKGKVNWGGWRRGTLGNPPLLLGGAIVTVLLFMVLFGPRIVPFSPNTTQILVRVDGAWITPPFPPSETHIWGTDPIGRDIFSLVVAGAQQTILMAVAVVANRILIGFVLGLLAGWFHDSWLDRIIVGATQALAVFPTLVMAALLIFLIGFDGGMRTFVIALSLVGWGEIVQFVRGEVATIRPQPFIESAISVGQRTSRLFLIHVLPNLAPALISLAAIELGAVLLILGELGFIGIFLQGGAGTDFGLYAMVPEWGSLLSNIRNWIRSYPWVGIYPTMAFFFAILGFNLFGEGLRRLIEEVGLVINRLFNRYTFALLGVAVAGLFWMRTNTGELVFFREQATEFDGQLAMEHIQNLTALENGGRSLGSPGLTNAAEYIRDEFRALGLQPAGEARTYFQSDVRSYLTLDSVPVVSIADGGPELEYLQDFAVYAGPTQNLGEVSGQVRLLAFGENAGLGGVDLSQDVVLLFSEADLELVQDTACRGVLLLARDFSVIKRWHTLSPIPPTKQGCGQGTPVMWVSDKVVNRILQGTDMYVTNLIEIFAEMPADEIVNFPTGVQVDVQINGTVQENVPVVNVIGHLPGTSQSLDDELIIVAAQYDSPPAYLPGAYPGANDNASGVAAMLEAIRSMEASGYQPLRTFLFVAYSGEGLPEMAPAPDILSFLQAKTGFDSAFDVQGVIFLRGLAGGGENTLSLWSEENSEFAKLLQTAANISGMDTERNQGHPAMNQFVPTEGELSEAIDFPVVGLSRQGWDRGARLAGDSMTFLKSADLEASGEALSLSLMILGRP
jgi:ABC-type dipeptide/oligopeptide/nickel transport system permease component